MLHVGVLASHQGTNFQAIIDACAENQIDARVAVLICNNSNAPVLERARQADIPAHHLSSGTHPDPLELDQAICDVMQTSGADLIVLAGYMKKLGPLVLEQYRGRIINVHPSLLPRHGGKGYFGRKVHEAVISSGDSQTGATVHLVSEEYDAGDVLSQEVIDVHGHDTPESLESRVHTIEHRLLLSTIDQFSRNLAS